MAFIRVQKPKTDENGNIVGGSASVVESVYVPNKGKNHCRQKVRESLGKVVFMDPDRKAGVFLSKTRGLVQYDSVKDEFELVERGDERIDPGEVYPEPNVHTLFGDSYVLLEYLRINGMLRVLRNVACTRGEFYKHMLCHLVHGVLRDCARIRCDRFIERSYMSNVVDMDLKHLRTDTPYFEMMGDYETKMSFFKGFVDLMRSTEPGFGRCCYIDSTPLPNSIGDLPTNRLCSHGISATSTQTRLVLVLDILTGLPVWFDLIPGNILDLQTIMKTMDGVSRNLDVTISDLVLDAGYVCKDVISAYNLDNDNGKTMIARMPNKKGYPYDELFDSTHRLFSNAKYSFVREKHTYFGIRKEIEIFGRREYAYVFVDDENASSAFKDLLSRRSDEYGSMKMKDKNRARYGGGFFILISNMEKTPSEILDDYFGRVSIEIVFKTAKGYLGLLPLNRQNEMTVNGKILQDVVDTTVFLMLRKLTVPTGRSLSDYIYDLQSVMAHRSGKDIITVEYINKRARNAFNVFGVDVVSSLVLDSYKDSIYL